MLMDESIMKNLQSIKGFMGASIYNYTEERLACNTQRLPGNTEETFATFNDICINSHKVSKNLKLGTTKIMEIQTLKGKVIKVIRGCSSKDARVHLHIYAMFSDDGNVALGEKIINKMLPQVVGSLS